ncbi:MAG: WbqC family protein [Paludibacteraceae bacterium]|nr:WbqC family protein [Paludibacteraceae bacterium]
MKLAIMQPYFMPYLGYWQAIAAVDKYVVYDDVQYIKGGWINRNNLIIGGQKKMFTIIQDGASPNKLINEISFKDNFKGFLMTVRCNYSKAPFFSDIFPLLEEICSYEKRGIGDFVFNSFNVICNYLDVKTELILSSSLEKDTTLRAEKKVMQICHILGADTYINAIGGQELYSKDEFAENGITLKFIKMDDTISYKQNIDEFIPNLSIIDVLMLNGKEGTKSLLNRYTLI